MSAIASLPRDSSCRLRLAVNTATLAVLLQTAALAQVVAPTASLTQPPKEDEPVMLEAFEVVMTQDKGYHSPYSGTALKTNEEIMKVPQSITVLTRDLIDDIASFDLSDMLNYIGVGNFQQGDSAYVRGNNANLNTDGARLRHDRLDLRRPRTDRRALWWELEHHRRGGPANPGAA